VTTLNGRSVSHLNGRSAFRSCQVALFRYARVQYRAFSATPVIPHELCRACGRPWLAPACGLPGQAHRTGVHA